MSEKPREPPRPAVPGSRAWLDTVVRHGATPAPMQDLYHRLLDMSWGRFLASLMVGYFAINTVFACLYLLGDNNIENAAPGSFRDAFFFSVQTLATIGYGKMVPRTTWANVVVSVEAMMGILSTAMGTGLMFAKFARPTARVLFSRVALMTRRDGVDSLLFRMANERGNQIVEASLHVALGRSEVTVEGERVRRFYDLTLVRSQNPSFALSWTAVHPITRGSLLHDATPESLEACDAMIIVSLVGIDETSGQTVHARHAYRAQDLLWNHRFVDILSDTADGRRQIDFRVFHDTVPVERT